MCIRDRAKIGVLSVRPDGLDRLARVTDVVFDKTGTLSDGKPVLQLSLIHI